MADTAVLVLGCTVITTWGRDQIRLLTEQAARRGITVIGADTPANLRGALPAELERVDEVVALEVSDPDACRAWVAGRTDIDAVVTIRELAVYAAAVTARELGVPGNDPAVVERIRNKDLARECLRQAGFAQPVTALCADLAEAERFCAEHGPGPWIVKPRDGLASIGVTLVTEPKELPAALDRFGTPPPGMGSLPASGSFLIETYVSGTEFSAEGVLVGGVPQVLALTRKTITPDFVEIGHRQPPGLDETTTAAAVDAVTRAVTTVGITRGIFHVEFWVTDDGIVLGELHDRPGGDYIHTLVEHHRPGLELYGTLLDDLLDRTPAPVPPARNAAASRFLFAPPGRLRAVRGWDRVRTHPAVLAADLWIEPGQLITPTSDAFSRHGVFVVGGDTPEEVDRVVAQLHDQIAFDLE